MSRPSKPRGSMTSTYFNGREVLKAGVQNSFYNECTQVQYVCDMLSANKWKISLRQQRQQDYCCHLLTAHSRRARIKQTIPHTWLTRLSEYKVKHLFRTRCQRKQSLTYISLFTSYLDIICLIACISDTSFAYNQKVDCQEVDSLNNKEYVTISLETYPSDSLTAGR